QRFVFDGLFGTGEGDDFFGELFERDLRRVADIDGKVVVAEQQAVDAFYEIVHIAERAGLAAVTENGEVLAPEGLADKGGEWVAVVQAHPGVVSVKDPDESG